MKLNLLTVTSLLCGLLFLGSCAKDEPQGNTKKEQSVAGGPLVSIDLDMDVAVAEFNESEAKAQEGRAFTSPQTPVTVKEGKNKELDDNLEPIAGKQQKILSLLRDKFIENNQTIDVVMLFECGTKMANVVTKMKYDDAIKRYHHKGNIEVPQEILTEMGNGQSAKVTIYTGGSRYDEANERFVVDPVMEEISLSSIASTPLNIPILYVSTGTELKVENNKLVSASTELDKLKPQGSLLLVTFRNNMDQNVTFDGITAVSNNYFGPNNQSKKTFLKVKGQHNPATELTTEAPAYESPYSMAVYGGKSYTYFAKDFTSPEFSVAKGGVRSDKAVVFWGIKGDAVSVSSPSANGLGDNGYLVNPAAGLIHIYAKNAKQGGQDIIYPNYNIAPIGGAHFVPQSGKAYTLNCEFYTQPRQALGYLDKGYLYKDGGTWKHHVFNGEGNNNPTIYNTPEMRKVPLVSSAEASEVYNRGVQTSKGSMRIMNQAWLNLTSLLWPVEFSADANSRRFKDLSSSFAKGGDRAATDYRGHIYKELLPYKATDDDTSEFTESEFICADYAKKDQAAGSGAIGIAYRHLYISPRNSEGAQPRSKYQTLARYLTVGQQAEGATYVGSLVIESLYLGKYFVGNALTTPIYFTGNAGDPFVYTQQSALFAPGSKPASGMVTRALLSADLFNNVDETEVLQTYASLKASRQSLPDKGMESGIKLVHWGVVKDQWELAVIKLGNDYDKVVDYGKNTFNEVTSLSIVNRFYGYNGFDGGLFTLWRNKQLENDDKTGLFRKYIYQPMRAYSLKYQGDNGLDTSKY